MSQSHTSETEKCNHKKEKIKKNRYKKANDVQTNNIKISFPPFSADVLVTVRAQVMTRDENAGGWLALDGGGLAIVSVRRRPRLTPITDEAGNIQTHEYIIYGQRISDQSVRVHQ